MGRMKGGPTKTTYADLLRIRELWKVGREGVPRKLSAEEIGAMIGVSRMTVYRVVELDETEIALRRQHEEKRLRG